MMAPTTLYWMYRRIGRSEKCPNRSSDMKIEPNVGNAYRILCVVVGVVLIAVPFALSLAGWIKVVVPVLGVLSIATGATGW